MVNIIKITKKEMWSKRFLNLDSVYFDGIGSMELTYLIRSMMKYTEPDKKYIWVMSDVVENRLLNDMEFPEILNVNGELAYLFGVPVIFERFLSIEKSKDSFEEQDEVIAYPYIWLKERETEILPADTKLSEMTFLNESYIKINKHMMAIDDIIRDMVNIYEAIIDPSTEKVRSYREKLNAHVKQFL